MLYFNRTLSFHLSAACAAFHEAWTGFLEAVYCDLDVGHKELSQNKACTTCERPEFVSWKCPYFTEDEQYYLYAEQIFRFCTCDRISKSTDQDTQTSPITLLKDHNEWDKACKPQELKTDLEKPLQLLLAEPHTIPSGSRSHELHDKLQEINNLLQLTTLQTSRIRQHERKFDQRLKMLSQPSRDTPRGIRQTFAATHEDLEANAEVLRRLLLRLIIESTKCGDSLERDRQRWLSRRRVALREFPKYNKPTKELEEFQNTLPEKFPSDLDDLDEEWLVDIVDHWHQINRNLKRLSDQVHPHTDRTLKNGSTLFEVEENKKMTNEEVVCKVDNLRKSLGGEYVDERGLLPVELESAAGEGDAYTEAEKAVLNDTAQDTDDEEEEEEEEVVVVDNGSVKDKVTASNIIPAHADPRLKQFLLPEELRRQSQASQSAADVVETKDDNEEDSL